MLKTGLLLRAASVCCSCFSSVSEPVFLYTLPAGPAGVYGRGSASALPRVGPHQAPAQQAPGGRSSHRAKLEEKGMGEGSWELVMGTGMGEMGKGGWGVRDGGPRSESSRPPPPPRLHHYPPTPAQPPP